MPAMRRLARHLLMLCSAAALVLCVGLTLMVVGSDRHLYRLMLAYDDARGVARWVEVMDGGFQYGESDHPLFRDHPRWGSMATPADSSMVRDRFLGFGSQTHTFGGTRPRRRITVWRMPPWPVLLLTALAALPAWHATVKLAKGAVVWVARRRHGRVAPGFEVLPAARRDAPGE